MRTNRARFSIEDTVIVDVYDNEGNTLYSRLIHKRSPRFVVAEIERYAKWHNHVNEVHTSIIGDYDSRESDRFFASDWDISLFLY